VSRPSKVTRLPETLRKRVERRLSEQGFSDYKGLASSIRQYGHEISVRSLQRYGATLTRDSEPTHLLALQSPKMEGVPPDSPAMTESLVKLTQEKLWSALSEIDQLKQGDMSRLAHAVAHLTQAAISLRRWTDQRAEERERDDHEAEDEPRGGLSPETSQALRNALLGLAPFNLEQASNEPDEKDAHVRLATPAPDEIHEEEDTSLTRPSATPLKRRHVEKP
jgi:hypothetical protein